MSTIPAVVIPLFTTPSKASDSPTLLNHHALVSAMRFRDAQMAELKAAQAIDRKELLLATDELQRKTEALGVACPRVDVESDDGPAVRVTYVDGYRAMDRSCVPALERILGPDFGSTFGLGESISFAKGATTDQLRVVLGDRYDALAPFITVTEYVKPHKGYHARRARLRVLADEELNYVLDAIEQNRNTPKVLLRSKK